MDRPDPGHDEARAPGRKHRRRLYPADTRRSPRDRHRRVTNHDPGRAVSRSAREANGPVDVGRALVFSAPPGTLRPVDSDPLFDRLQRALGPDYRLEHLIGSGGMGKVYLATDLTLNAPVAVKVLRPEIATAHASEAFTREAQILAHVRHPNIVTIHHAPPRKEGLDFYIMERSEERRVGKEGRTGSAAEPT